MRVEEEKPRLPGFSETPTFSPCICFNNGKLVLISIPIPHIRHRRTIKMCHGDTEIKYYDKLCPFTKYLLTLALRGVDEQKYTSPEILALTL